MNFKFRVDEDAYYALCDKFGYVLGTIITILNIIIFIPILIVLIPLFIVVMLINILFK